MALAPPTAVGQRASEGGVDFVGVDSGGGTLVWDIAPDANDSVLDTNINGPAVIDVTDRSAVVATLTADVSGITWTGWDTDTTLFQSVRVSIQQNAVGGHSFNWAGVEGRWAELPGVGDDAPNDTTLEFYATTTDAGATVVLEPIGVRYASECLTAQVADTTVPANGANGTVTISHNFSVVGTVELIEVATGRRILADWQQTPGDPAAPIVINFTDANPAGTYTVRVVGQATEPCELTTATSTWETLVLSAAAATTLNARFTYVGAGDVEILWGDGTVEPVASGVALSHTYGAAYSGDVTLRYRPGVSITRMQAFTGPWSFNMNVLPATLTHFQATTNNVTTGSVENLPAGLVAYINTGSNTTSGDIGSGNLPAGLLIYTNTGSNTTSGDIGSGNLPAGLTTFNNLGSNTTSGDIGSGNLPAGLTVYNNVGNNTTSGDIGSGNLPAGLTTFINAGTNTTTGDIGSGNLPAGLVTYSNRGNSNVTMTAAPTFDAALGTFFQDGVTAFTQQNVDDILVAIDALGTNNGGTTSPDILLGGTSASPSAVGTAAANNLIARGWTVATN